MCFPCIFSVSFILYNIFMQYEECYRNVCTCLFTEFVYYFQNKIINFSYPRKDYYKGICVSKLIPLGKGLQASHFAHILSQKTSKFVHILIFCIKPHIFCKTLARFLKGIWEKYQVVEAWKPLPKLISKWNLCDFSKILQKNDSFFSLIFNLFNFLFIL